MIRDTSSLLTVREVSDRLRVSLATAYVLIKQGDIACCRVGGKRGAIRVREAELANYLQESENAIEQAQDAAPLVQEKTLKHLRLH